MRLFYAGYDSSKSINYSATRQWQFTGDGSATFAGDRVKINATGDYALESSAFVKVVGGVTVNRSGSNRVDLGSIDIANSNKEAALSFTSNGTDYSFIYMDGSANFAGTVTAPNITAFRTTLRDAVTTANTLSELKIAILNALEQLGGDE